MRPAAALAPRARGHLALLGAAAIWGGSFVATDAALARSGPFTILALRFTIALACLLPWAYRHGFTARLSLRRRVIVFGLTGIVLHLGLETSGLLFTSPANASLIVAAIPGVTVALAALVLRERPGPMNLLGIGLSIAGVIVVTYSPAPGTGPLNALGTLLVLGGVVAWAAFTVQGRRMRDDHPPLVSTTAAVAASLLFLVPLAAGEIALTGGPRLDATASAAILYLGLLASGAAFLLWNSSLRYVTAGSASTYINLVPVLGVALAVVAGEAVTTGQLVGGAVVGAGVWLSNRGRTQVAS